MRIEGLTKRDIEILRLYKKQKNCSFIAREMELKPYVVSHRAKKLGLKFHKFGEAHAIFNSKKYKKFNIPLTKEESWALGALASDGYMSQASKNSYNINIGVAIRDEDFVDKIKKIVPTLHKYLSNGTYKGEPYPMYFLQCGNKELLEKLFYLGIHVNKTYSIAPPVNIEDVRFRDYVRGLWDGDGSIYVLKKKNNRKYFMIEFGTASYWMFTFMENLMKKVINDSVGTKYEEAEYGTFYHLLLYCTKAKGFLDWLYKDSTNKTRLARKYNLYKNTIEEQRLRA